MSRTGYLLDVFWSLLSDDRSSKDEVGEMKPSAKIDIQKVNAYVECLFSFYISRQICMGPFNNYVDQMRGGGGPKMSVFVHAQVKRWQNCVLVVVE